MKTFRLIFALLASSYYTQAINLEMLLKGGCYITIGTISTIIIVKTNSVDQVLQPVMGGVAQGLAPVAATSIKQQIDKLFEHPHDKEIEKLTQERINLQEKFKVIQGIADKLPNPQQQLASLAQQSLNVEKKITKLEESKQFSLNYGKKKKFLP